MTGGLAAALLPVVENTGAIWVGSSGRVRDGSQDPFAEIESLGARELIEAMLAYDLIGFQTGEDCENFLSAVQQELDLPVHGGVVLSRYGRTRAAVFPIGIDVELFAQYAAKASSHPEVSRLRRSLNGERLAIGVDRLDYSKGLTNRIRAFDKMWSDQPSLLRSASLLQIATPSRGAIE